MHGHIATRPLIIFGKGLGVEFYRRRRLTSALRDGMPHRQHITRGGYVVHAQDACAALCGQQGGGEAGGQLQAINGYLSNHQRTRIDEMTVNQPTFAYLRFCMYICV